MIVAYIQNKNLNSGFGLSIGTAKVDRYYLQVGDLGIATTSSLVSCLIMRHRWSLVNLLCVNRNSQGIYNNQTQDDTVWQLTGNSPEAISRACSM